MGVIEMTSQEQQLRDVAEALRKYTTVTRAYNGKGRRRTYAADVDTIAETGRQLAEMVELFLDGRLEVHDTGNNAF